MKSQIQATVKIYSEYLGFSRKPKEKLIPHETPGKPQVLIGAHFFCN